jgi:hypothetical protein
MQLLGAVGKLPWKSAPTDFEKEAAILVGGSQGKLPEGHLSETATQVCPSPGAAAPPLGCCSDLTKRELNSLPPPLPPLFPTHFIQKSFQTSILQWGLGGN